VSVKWVRRDVIDIIHSQQVAAHGGLMGVEDEDALEAALARPMNKAAYGETNLARLASGYAFGLAKARAFHDGNKRIAFLSAALFLGLNGVGFEPKQTDVVITIRNLAAGLISEDELAAWFAANSRKVG
jgi:death-on-curing protein